MEEPKLTHPPTVYLEKLRALKNPVEVRLMAGLPFLMDERGVIPYTQIEMGEIVGLGQGAVSRAMQGLMRAGVVVKGRKATRDPRWRVVRDLVGC